MGQVLCSPVAVPSPYTIYTTSPSGQITPLSFTPPATLNSVSQSPKHATGENPLWIGYGKDQILNYVIDGSDVGRVFVAEAEADDRQDVRVIGRTDGYKTQSSGPVAATVVNDCLYVANYGSGSATVLQLNDKGLPDDANNASSTTTFTFTRNGTGPVTDRQDKSYAHDVVPSPDNDWVYAVDLGADRIHHIKTPAKGQSCAEATFNPSQSTVLPPGTGPRHVAFYHEPLPVGGRHFAYLCNELGGTVIAYSQNSRTGALTMINGPVYGRPKDVAPGGNLTAGPARALAEVAISQDGRFVYVSDRGDTEEDHVSLFARDLLTGALSFVDWFASGGKSPRHFSLSHDDRFLAVAHEQSGNVAILKRNALTGTLSKTGADVSMEGVNFAGFVF